MLKIHFIQLIILDNTIYNMINLIMCKIVKYK